MKICQVKGCNQPGQRHHIVFRSQGGLDFKLNYKYLCPEHHTGNESPHKKKEIDLRYKREMQMELLALFFEDTYTLPQIIELIGEDKKDLEKKFRKVPNAVGLYKREDIVRALMGGRLY